jgi:hypothetical protein
VAEIRTFLFGVDTAITPAIIQAFAKVPRRKGATPRRCDAEKEAKAEWPDGRQNADQSEPRI